MKARTARANQIRGLLGEFGVIVPQLIEAASIELPGSFCVLIQRLREHLKLLHHQIEEIEARIKKLPSLEQNEPAAGEGAGHRAVEGRRAGCDCG